MKYRKGIILAGGLGTRMYPVTNGISKQLLPVFDKPMIYYPLSVLMLSGIKDILIITNPQDMSQFQRVLGDGNQWGIRLSYKAQLAPEGLAHAFILAESFLDGHPSALILGDNLFFGHDLMRILQSAMSTEKGASILGYHVSNPKDYGVVSYNADGEVTGIVEKPETPPSNIAITGLYFVDCTASDRAKLVKPSHRGELEITSLLESYLEDKSLKLTQLGRGIAWLDTGTHNSLLDAANFVRTLTEKQGLQVGSPDEVAYRLGYINKAQLIENANKFSKSQYGEYLNRLSEM